MRAWVVRRPAPDRRRPARARRARRARARVRARSASGCSTCGVCRTDLHLAEGDLAPHAPDVVPGHEVVGVVDTRRRRRATASSVGERVGIAWLRHTCGICRFCVRGDENLCIDPRFTGWDADGGYAELAVVDERYAYRAARTGSTTTRPRRCCAPGSSATGRCGGPSCRPGRPARHLRLRRVGAPRRPGRDRTKDCRVHVMTRSADARRSRSSSARPRRGTRSTRRPSRSTPRSCSPRPASSSRPRSRALDRGGTLAIAGIHLTDIPPLRYADHLFEERQLRSVTANTRQDGEEFLAPRRRDPGPGRPRRRTRSTTRPTALRDLAHDRVDGAAVLHVTDPGASAGTGSEDPGPERRPRSE